VLSTLWHARSAEVRRRRVVVGAAAGFATVVLAVSFPFTTLFSQHRQLTAAAAQLAAVRQQNRQLLEQEHQLGSKAEIERRARQDYQLVQPGQTLFNLLPGPGSHTVSAGGPTSGDPGAQPLVQPSRAPDLAPDPGLPSPPPASTSASRGSSSDRAGNHSPGTGGAAGRSPSAPTSFLSRVAGTLEFWK
jgi:cell division protein FtsB